MSPKPYDSLSLDDKASVTKLLLGAYTVEGPDQSSTLDLGCSAVAEALKLAEMSLEIPPYPATSGQDVDKQMTDVGIPGFTIQSKERDYCSNQRAITK